MCWWVCGIVTWFIVLTYWDVGLCWGVRCLVLTLLSKIRDGNEFMNKKDVWKTRDLVISGEVNIWQFSLIICIPIQYHVNIRLSWCKYWSRFTSCSFMHSSCCYENISGAVSVKFSLLILPHSHFIPVLYFWTHGPAFESNFWWQIPSYMNRQVQNIYYCFSKENNALILNVLVALL